MNKLSFRHRQMGFRARKSQRARRCKPLLLAAAAAGGLLCASQASATLISWAVAGGGDFNTPSNWDPASVPTSADTAIFSNNINDTVTLSADSASAELSLRNTSGAINLDLGGKTYSLGKITMGTAAGQVNDLTISNGTISHSATATLLAIGSFAGSDGNKLTLTGSNTRMISTATSAGQILGAAGSNNNKLIVTSGAVFDTKNNVTVGVIGATPSSGNSIEVTNASFSIVGGNRGVVLNQGTLTITNSLADLGMLTANAAGNTAWINFNSGTMYSRRTGVANGQPFTIGDGGSTLAQYGFAYSAATMTVNNGLVINSNGKLFGTGTITGDVTGVAGAKVAPSIVNQTILTTDDRAIGTITVIGNWDNHGIDLNLELGDFPTQVINDTTPPFDPPVDLLNVNGTFTNGGTITLDLANYIPPQDQNYDARVVGWSSTSGSTANTTVQFINGSPLTYDFRSDGLYVQAAKVVANSRWNVDLDGNWSTTTNWSPANPPNGIDGVANFGTIITDARTVTVNAPKTVGTVNFDSPNSYTIAGTESLTLDVSSGQAAINVADGSHTISAPLVLNDDLSVTVTPAASTLSITGALSAAGKTITKAGAGALQFENLQAAGLAVNEGAVRISPKATANDPAGTSTVQSLSIASGARLDLANNSAVIDYSGAVGTLVDDVRQHLAAGRLMSSSADATKNLGYADNAALGLGSFAGQTVDADSLLIKYTYLGDTNLDGQVDVIDLGNLATGWQTNGVWANGDSNYDGFIDVIDLGLLATNWQAGVGSPLGPGSLGQALAGYGLPSVAVPEPGSLAALLLGTAGFLRRSRRRK